MTQPQLTREPEDGRIERWLTERQRRLPSPDREAVLGRALRRLSQTPQRRRWWLPRWLPFGMGATRSSVPAEPRIQGRTRMMFSATRVAALVAVLALGGSLALVAGPLAPEGEAPVDPAAEAPGLESAAHFYGTGMVKIMQIGDSVEIDGVPHLVGHLSQMPAEWKEVADPRAGGTETFDQTAADLGGFGPTWGSFRIEDEDGAWVGDVSGFWHGATTEVSGWLTGEGAYESLIMYYQVDAMSAVEVSFSGMIYPASAPPLEVSSG